MTTKLCNPRDISIVHTTKLFRLMPPPTPSPKSTTKALEIPVMNWRCEGDDEGENKGREYQCPSETQAAVSTVNDNSFLPRVLLVTLLFATYPP